MPTALLSVSNKRDLVDLARSLIELGWNLIASGGTANALRQVGLSVQDVADYTGSPEILDGRVKTLHPAVHGGILARSTPEDAAELERLNARMISMVVVNLYPFQETISKSSATMDEAIENIDIGGVALIRAAAKNFIRVAVVTDPADYASILKELRRDGEVSLKSRRELAEKAFSHTAAYDAAIASYFQHLDDSNATGTDLGSLQLNLFPVSALRYGENPHQEATLYAYQPDTGPLGGQLLQGKALSYNNLLDLDAAWRAVVPFERPSVCIVKHLSPCGLASAGSLAEAFPLALASDPVSAFGGVIATNRSFDPETARALGDLFIECIVSPGFMDEALEILAKRKNLRLVSMPGVQVEPLYEMRSINQGVLRQAVDLGDPIQVEWRVVSERQPAPQEWRALHFAWRACQHVKSNAIVFAQGEATVGIGGGQPNRVDCVRIAAQRAGEKSQGAVMASDAFFPFPDSIEEAARVGITAVVQPGGSVRDGESIAAANRNQMAMVFTGVRHFRH